MDSNRALEMNNLQALIGLWQQEERRLHSIVGNPIASAETKESLAITSRTIP
jgi:hypothetical protein